MERALCNEGDTKIKRKERGGSLYFLAARVGGASWPLRFYKKGRWKRTGPSFRVSSGVQQQVGHWNHSTKLKIHFFEIRNASTLKTKTKQKGLTSETRWKEKSKEKNGESSSSCDFIVVIEQFDCDCAAHGSATRSDGHQRASGNPNVPVQIERAGAAHAQEPQSIQTGSDPARHRLHLRPAERTGTKPSGQPQPQSEETRAAGAHLRRFQRDVVVVCRHHFDATSATPRSARIHSQHIHRGE